MDPNQVSSRLRQIASKLEASKNPNRELVAADIRDLIATVAGSRKPMKEKSEKSEKSKPGLKKDDGGQTASAAHLGLLEKYKGFHDMGSEVLGFRDMISHMVPDTIAPDITRAKGECDKTFRELEEAMKNARAAYSTLMAGLAKY